MTSEEANEREALAYVAGIVDGEGYIGLEKIRPSWPSNKRARNPQYVIRINIRMASEVVVKFVSETLQGSYRLEGKNYRATPLFCWSQTGFKAEQVLLRLFPFLKGKKQDAIIALDLRKLQQNRKLYLTRVLRTDSWKHWRSGKILQVPRFSYTKEYVEKCELLYQSMRKLHSREPRPPASTYPDTAESGDTYRVEMGEAVPQ